LVLRDVTMEPSNVSKNKGIIECNKSMIRCDVGTTYVKMEPSNVKKNMGTIECGKSTVTCDVGTA